MPDTLNKIYHPDKISLREVGLRDGLQMVAQFPSTDARKRWISEEHAAGIRHFELGSFLPKVGYPAFADVEILVDYAGDINNLHSVALCPNLRGAKNALKSKVAELTCVVSASEAHNLANLNRSQKQTLDEIAMVCGLRDKTHHRPLISVGIAMSFGCSISGNVGPGEVVDIAAKCFESGVDMVWLADTVGYAGPKQVENLIERVRGSLGDQPIGIHLHDTRGLGLANASAALNAGVQALDASLGGLGGCPFAPNATGNIVMEDLAFLCQKEGFETGINIEALVAVRQILETEMPAEILCGGYAKAGSPRLIP